jgi:hypothetical protein
MTTECSGKLFEFHPRGSAKCGPILMAGRSPAMGWAAAAGGGEASGNHRADAANPDMHLVGLDAARIFRNTASLPRNSNQSKQEVIDSEDPMRSFRGIQKLPPFWNGLWLRVLMFLILSCLLKISRCPHETGPRCTWCARLIQAMRAKQLEPRNLFWDGTEER